jgi:hypothetical protein
MQRLEVSGAVHVYIYIYVFRRQRVKEHTRVPPSKTSRAHLIFVHDGSLSYFLRNQTLGAFGKLRQVIISVAMSLSVCLPFCLSVRPHRTRRLTIEGFSRNLSIFMKFRYFREIRVFYEILVLSWNLGISCNSSIFMNLSIFMKFGSFHETWVFSWI